MLVSSRERTSPSPPPSATAGVPTATGRSRGRRRCARGTRPGRSTSSASSAASWLPPVLSSRGTVLGVASPLSGRSGATTSPAHVGVISVTAAARCRVATFTATLPVARRTRSIRHSSTTRAAPQLSENMWEGRVTMTRTRTGKDKDIDVIQTRLLHVLYVDLLHVTTWVRDR